LGISTLRDRVCISNILMLFGLGLGNRISIGRQEVPQSWRMMLNSVAMI